MKIVAVTCARLESTRIKHKCLQNVGGKKLLRHTIDFAKKLGYQYFIFTKDAKIKECAYDCEIIHEPENLYDIPGNILEKLIYINNILQADFIILLQATSPIRNLDLYRYWIDDFINSNFNIGFSVFQEDRKTYKMNGAFFIMRQENLNIKNVDIITNNCKMYLDFQNLDIDTEEDLKKVREYYDIRGGY